MNLVLILAIVGYFWTKIRQTNSPYAQLENRIYQDLICLQTDASWVMQIKSKDTASHVPFQKDHAFEKFYLLRLKDALLKGQPLTSSLESLCKVLGSLNLVYSQLQDLRNNFQAKIFLQILIVLVVRVILGKFWLQGWQDVSLILSASLLLAVIWWIFERLLPKPQLGNFASFQSWLELLMSAGESRPESCPGIQTMLHLERKNGIGRREARLQRVIQDLLLRCRDDGKRCERFADTLVAFELLTGMLLLGGLLMIPLLDTFKT